ncbi:MAG: ATP-dependent RNA helicase DeaD [Phycisphaerales bacterium]|jgi:ATP-dependent RNA helicase DeaD
MSDEDQTQTPTSNEPSNENGGEGGGKKRRRRRGKRGGKKAEDGTTTEGTPAPSEAADSGDEPQRERPPRAEGGRGEGGRGEGGRGESGGGKKRTRKRSGGGSGGGGGGRDPGSEKEPERRKRVAHDSFSEETFDTDKTFADLGLKPEVMEGINEAGFIHPTHIQSTLIPIALTGKDIIGQAKTGTGKTLGFGLPLLHMCEPGRRFQALILAPTRELAVQIRQDLDEVGTGAGLDTCTVYGGQSINTQAAHLAKGPEIIVGTPGRVMDMVGRGYLTFSDFKFVVLDEVDRMFDFGFRDDMKKILSACPKERQTIFVSATITDEIEGLARRYMSDPEKLVVTKGSLTVDLVKQSYVTVEPWDKRRMLAHLLTHEEPAVTLVFCRMKRTVDSVVRYLERKNIDAHAIHGDMSQGERNRVMSKFRDGTLSVLVASDLASRGLDVQGITHVVNFDLPDEADAYVHRIGRTARAGREGVAWSLVRTDEGKMLSEIENLINVEIPERFYPEFESSEKPDGWKDEPKGGRPIIEIQGVESVKRNRLAAEEVPDETKLDAAQMAAKFPGGIVPKKMPKRTMGGKVKRRGGR